MKPTIKVEEIDYADTIGGKIISKIPRKTLYLISVYFAFSILCGSIIWLLSLCGYLSPIWMSANFLLFPALINFSANLNKKLALKVLTYFDCYFTMFYACMMGFSLIASLKNHSHLSLIIPTTILFICIVVCGLFNDALEPFAREHYIKKTFPMLIPFLIVFQLW